MLIKISFLGLLSMVLTVPLAAQSLNLVDFDKFFVPHLIAGGEWRSEIVLTNHAHVARSVAFSAWRQDGSVWEWNLPHFQKETRQIGSFVDQFYVTTLASKETRILRFSRQGDAEFGWAFLPSCWNVNECGDVSGYVLLRNHNSLRQQDFELSYPFTDRGFSGYTMIFDQSNWAQIVLNISNAADTVPWETDALFEVKIFNESGTVVYTKDVFVKKGGTVITNFAHESDSLWGVVGRLEVRRKTGNTAMLVTGIRINDTGSFTPIQALQFR